MAVPFGRSTPILLLLLGACGAEVAPKDQLPCSSRGTLTPGVTRSGYLGEANCPFRSDITPSLATNRDRWTILLHPDTVYVISARYLVPAGGLGWAGRLLAYSVEGGDTLLRTGFWGTAATPEGELLHEMLLASATDREVIVHLERASPSDSGAYRLEARRCPILHLTPEVPSPSLTLDAGCPLWTAGTPGRARFFDYPSDSGVVRDVQVTPAEGGAVALHYAWAARPPFDFACWYAGGHCDLGTGGTAPFGIRPYPVDGITAAVIFTLGPATEFRLTVATVR